jgi:hypothetical protein
MKTVGCAGLLLVAGLAAAQPAADAVDFGARDAQLVASLAGSAGIGATAGRVAIYVPAGSMTPPEAQALAESLSRGVEGLISLTRSPRPWQRVPPRISYYFHAEMFISHADPANDRLFIAFPRLQNGQAPVLHEAVHVLLYPNAEFGGAHPELLDESAGSTWLHEGLATYVGFSVAADTGIAEGNPLGPEGLAGMDTSCAAALPTPAGAEVLPYIGAPGEPPALSSRSRRAEVAPVFYACATSFAKFLAQAVGVERVVDAIAARDSEAALAAAAGTSLDELKTQWRRAIGAN